MTSLVDLAAAGKPVDFENEFLKLLGAKVDAAVENKKTEMQNAMFSTTYDDDSTDQD